jgi:hypothetical protein
MNEIKPVSIKTAEQRITEKYRGHAGMADESMWLDATEAEAAELRAALEALQAENAKLKEDLQSFASLENAVNERGEGSALVELTEANAAQAKRIEQMQHTIDHLQTRADLYEIVRKFNVPQFESIFCESIEGRRNFDFLVALSAQKGTE